MLWLADEMKAVKITWKNDEQWLYDYVKEHSSPAAWFKDLAIADYKKTHGEDTQKINGGNNKPFQFFD